MDWPQLSNLSAWNDDSIQEKFTNLAHLGNATRRARRCKTQGSFQLLGLPRWQAFFLTGLIV